MSSFKELQERIVAKRAERGFATDPLKIYLMLSEEPGEVAAELKRTWSTNYDGFDKARLSDEIADVFALHTALANEFDIDIEEAVESKFFVKDSKRKWNTGLS